MIKRFTATVLAMLCLFALLPTFVSAQSDDDASSLSYIVYEQETKQIILQQNIFQLSDATLLSRMMCALVVLEYSFNGDGQTVSTTDYVTPVSYSVSSDGKYKLYASKQYTVETLMKASLLANADNCARVLADYINPDTNFFVARMNQTAARIGMKDTFFTSPDGSKKSLQQTTAYDIALFYDYALKNPQFKLILTNEVTRLWDGIPLLNTCSIAFTLKKEFDSPAAGGVYTGTTQTDGSSLMMHMTLPAPESASAGDTRAMKLIVVFLTHGKEDASQYAHDLITDVHTNYRRAHIISSKQELDIQMIADVPLRLLAGTDLYCVTPAEIDGKSYVQNISYTFSTSDGNIDSTQGLNPPILEGQVLGTAHLLLRDGSIQTVSVIAGNTIQTDSQTVNRLLEIYEEYKPLFILIFVLLTLETILLLYKLFFFLRLRKNG